MFFGQTKYWVQFYIVFGTFAHFFCKCHYLTTINQHNRLICVFKEFFSVFWTDRGRRCTFYRFSVVLLVIRFCKSVTKRQCFQDRQKGQCHTVGLHLKGKQTSLTLGVLCLPQLRTSGKPSAAINRFGPTCWLRQMKPDVNAGRCLIKCHDFENVSEFEPKRIVLSLQASGLFQIGAKFCAAIGLVDERIPSGINL